MLKEGEGVPAVVADVVVGPLQHDDGEDRHDGDHERMQVKCFVKVPLKKLDPGAGESAAGAGMSRDD